MEKVSDLTKMYVYNSTTVLRRLKVTIAQNANRKSYLTS